MERILWWITLALFILVVVLGTFFLAALVATNPEATAFLLGFLGFWLFANRLIFAFSQIANAASSVASGELVEKEEIAKKLVKREEEVKLRNLTELSVAALLSMWRGALEPFKYAYYLAFFLLLLFSVLFELNVISSLVFGPIVEALTLGAAVPTVLVWGLELLADYYLAKAVLKASEEISKEQEQS
ncbi:hypothetical protein [Thermovibrio sp.]